MASAPSVCSPDVRADGSTPAVALPAAAARGPGRIVGSAPGARSPGGRWGSGASCVRAAPIPGGDRADRTRGDRRGDGEDERLARAVLSLARRADFDTAAFRTWLEVYPVQAKALWGKKPLDVAGFAAYDNGKHLLTSLYSLLAQVKEPTPALDAGRDDLLKTLAQI